MTTELITDRVWAAITEAARNTKTPAYVAVAYFGNGASKLLPLRKGSRLVVDASEHAVKSGQTSPAELLKLHRKGVKVYSIENLHAKVFVFGRTAFVGSANVSQRSNLYRSLPYEYLQENDAAMERRAITLAHLSVQSSFFVRTGIGD